MNNWLKAQNPHGMHAGKQIKYNNSFWYLPNSPSTGNKSSKSNGSWMNEIYGVYSHWIFIQFELNWFISDFERKPTEQAVGNRTNFRILLHPESQFPHLSVHYWLVPYSMERPQYECRLQRLFLSGTKNILTHSTALRTVNAKWNLRNADRLANLWMVMATVWTMKLSRTVEFFWWTDSMALINPLSPRLQRIFFTYYSASMLFGGNAVVIKDLRKKIIIRKLKEMTWPEGIIWTSFRELSE